MPTMKSTELPYPTNSIDLFEHFNHLPHAVLLSSGQTPHYKERYSILSANPCVVITVRGHTTTITENKKSITSHQDPFDLIKQALDKLSAQDTGSSSTIADTLPFHCGAIGFFGYDLARRFYNLPQQTTHDITLPDALIGLYDWSIVIDHQEKRCWLLSINAETPAYIQQLINTPPKKPAPFKLTRSFQSNMTQTQYTHAFEVIQHHLRQGDCYQTNLCQRFSADFQGSPWLAYKKLAANNPSPFSSYLKLNGDAIISFSPERFLRVWDRTLETKPIKGTAARSNDATQDLHAAQQLLASEKDKAENLMIVDLLRNDISKSCIPGSIKVPKLFALESFPHVHHLVSTVRGTLKKDQHALDILRHCFPGGSITGAPKLSAMNIIEKLEPHHRSVYCGSMGYVDINGNMDSNITIRTLICNQGRIHCYAGGAIVFDSNCDSEYEESCIKVRRMLEVLES